MTLNATAASLLGFLHDGPMTGWDLVATAQARIGAFWSITRSQVYRELAAMAGDGLVEAGERGRRDRRPYTITDDGRAAFAVWVRERPSEETIRFPLLLLIELGRHVPGDRLAVAVRTHRAIHAERLAGYEKMHEALAAEPEPDIYTMATLRYGLAYERAAMRWFDELPPEIAGPLA